jgi:hypothetical protein
VVRASGQTNQFRGGSTNAGSSYSSAPGFGSPNVRTGSNITGPLARPGTQTRTSAFGTAAKGILGGVISSAIRGRNPLSQFTVPNASNLLFQAGSAVGGVTGQKLIATGGLVRAGQTIARNGVGPGNFGTVAVALGALGQLGVRPENILPNVFGNKVTTNGTAVARQNTTGAVTSSPNFPIVTTAPNNTSSSYYSPPRYSDGRPTTINDSRDSIPPSNQSRPGGGFGRFV